MSLQEAIKQAEVEGKMLAKDFGRGFKPSKDPQQALNQAFYGSQGLQAAGQLGGQLGQFNYQYNPNMASTTYSANALLNK